MGVCARAIMWYTILNTWRRIAAGICIYIYTYIYIYIINQKSWYIFIQHPTVADWVNINQKWEPKKHQQLLSFRASRLHTKYVARRPCCPWMALDGIGLQGPSGTNNSDNTRDMDGQFLMLGGRISELQKRVVKPIRNLPSGADFLHPFMVFWGDDLFLNLPSDWIL